MSATDELRRLLNKRDVEWKSFEGDPLGFVKTETAWSEVDGLDNYNYWVTEYFDGTTLLNIGNPTPEQAVEATLGRETCENVGYYIDSTRFKCSACGYNGWTRYAADGEDRVPNYCPNCGRKVVDV